MGDSTVGVENHGGEFKVEIRSHSNIREPGDQNQNENRAAVIDHVNDDTTEKPKATELPQDWKPYESSSKEMPVTFFVPPVYYKIRWAWVQIFMRRVIYDISIGEIIVFILALGVAAGPAGGTCCSDESTGGAATIPLLLTFALASRNSIFTFLFGVPFERALKWHKWMALFSVISGAYHGIIAKKADKSWTVLRGDDVTGIVLTVLMGALVVFSFFPLRRWVFEIFLKLHWVLFIGVVVAALIHDAGVIMIGVGIWGFDVLCRCLVLWLNRRNSATVLLTRLPADVIRVSFKKNNFRYMSGQYVFICIPKVSYFEWHPFSLSSSPHNDEVYIHIRVLGNWTKQLYEKADSTETAAFIDGPYGQPSVDIDSDRYKIIVFISGGIGITPMQSICNDLIHQYQRGRPLLKIYFIWSVRDAFMVTSVLDYDTQYFGEKLPQRLPHSFSPDLLTENLRESVLDAQFYLTRAREPKDYASANIQPELQSCLRFGRPKLPEIFESVHKFAVASKENKVAVLSCGPNRLVGDALKYSSQYSKQGVYFDFHSELFEF